MYSSSRFTHQPVSSWSPCLMAEWWVNRRQPVWFLMDLQWDQRDLTPGDVGSVSPYSAADGMQHLSTQKCTSFHLGRSLKAKRWEKRRPNRWAARTGISTKTLRLADDVNPRIYKALNSKTMPPGCHQLHEYVDIFRHIQHASDASLKKKAGACWCYPVLEPRCLWPCSRFPRPWPLHRILLPSGHPIPAPTRDSARTILLLFVTVTFCYCNIIVTSIESMYQNWILTKFASV